MIGSSAQAGDMHVIDGDGFILDGREIRIWGIDAPELTQECVGRAGGVIPCGKHAKRFLGQILADSAPVCETVTHDQYGRHISRCQVNGQDLGALMVSSGWALDFERFSHGAYAGMQAVAKREKRGLWQGRFDLPWEWRNIEKGRGRGS